MRRGWPLLVLALLAACAAPPPVRGPDERQAAYQARSEQLGEWARWGLTGRLGLDGGEEGGSGRLDWDRSPERSSLRFRGALGQGAWRLEVTPDGARLERSDGSIGVAPDVDLLVWSETGWRIPVTALEWWVRGLPWPGAAPPEALELNGDGTVAGFRQLGWDVAITRYTALDDALLPSRLEASNDELTVKLAVSRWRGTAPGAAGDE